MNKENKKLGRGLSSLLSSTNNKDENLGEKIFKLINISSIKLIISTALVMYEQKSKQCFYPSPTRFVYICIY